MNWFMVVEVLTILAEFLIAAMFFKRFLGRNKCVRRWTVPLIGALYISAVFLSNAFLTNGAILFSITLAGLLVLSFLYGENIRHRLFSFALLVGFMLAADFIVTLGAVWLVSGSSAVTLFDHSVVQFSLKVISKFVLFIITKTVCNYRKNTTERIPKLSWIFLFAFPIASIAAIYGIAASMYPDFGTDVRLPALIFIILLFANILVFHLFETTLGKLSAESRNQLLQAQVDKHVTEFDRLVKQRDAEEGILHDYKNHLTALSSLAVGKESQEYILALQKKVKAIEKNYIDTGNAPIDAIFNDKIRLAESKGIAVKTKILIPAHFDIDIADLCSFFFNAWDNAIEACEKVDVEKRAIDVTLRHKYEGGLLIGHFSNPTDGNLLKGKKHFKTTKTGSGIHGRGLENMDRVAEKNGGVFSPEHDDETNTFNLAFSFYAPEHREVTKVA